MLKEVNINISSIVEFQRWRVLKVAFFQKLRFVFQISKSQKKNIPKNYPELEI